MKETIRFCCFSLTLSRLCRIAAHLWVGDFFAFLPVFLPFISFSHENTIRCTKLFVGQFNLFQSIFSIGF
jgi:hypothetical protein